MLVVVPKAVASCNLNRKQLCNKDATVLDPFCNYSSSFPQITRIPPPPNQIYSHALLFIHQI